MDNNVNNNEEPTLVSQNNVNNDRFVINNNIQTNPGVVSPQPVVENTVPVQSTPVVNPTPVVENNIPVQSTPVVNPTPVVENNIPVQSTPVVDNTSSIPQINNNPDPNAIINENLKKVEINYTPPSKGKVVLLVLFFIVLLGFIIFLPEINSLISKFRSGDVNVKDEKITTGKLVCTLNTNTTNLDKDYDLTFRFTDNKLEKTEFIITTKGDVTLDEETLDKLAGTCRQLKENVKDLKGVSIQCNYSEGKLEEVQSFDLAVIDSEKLDAAFTEAGGNNPEYQNGQDMDRIERNMNASGYSCKRER